MLKTRANFRLDIGPHIWPFNLLSMLPHAYSTLITLFNHSSIQFCCYSPQRRFKNTNLAWWMYTKKLHIYFTISMINTLLSSGIKGNLISLYPKSWTCEKGTPRKWKIKWEMTSLIKVSICCICKQENHTFLILWNLIFRYIFQFIVHRF